CGNQSTWLQRITWINDTTVPMFTGCPNGSIDLLCNPARPSCATVGALGITASDTCSGNITLVCTADDVVTNGCHLSQVFTLKATDGCNNSATCVVTYVWTEDTALPVFTGCPSSIIDLHCNPT